MNATTNFGLRLITHNKSLKLLSLAFSLLLFLLIRGQQVREFNKVARVNVVTAPNTMVIGQAERFLDVTIRHPNSLFVRQPTDKELVGELDVSSQPKGKYRIRLSRENFPHLDKRFTVVIHDPWLEIEVDKVATKRLPVRALLTGEPAEGFGIDKVTVEPTEVEIRGPQKELSQLRTLSTVPLEITDVEHDLSVASKVAVPSGSSIIIPKDKVNISVKLGPEKTMKFFRSVPIELLQRSKIRTEIRPSVVDIEVRGKPEVLAHLKPSDVRAFIDASELTSGWQDAKVGVKAPSGIEIVSILPEVVAVNVKR